MAPLRGNKTAVYHMIGTRKRREIQSDSFAILIPERLHLAITMELYTSHYWSRQDNQSFTKARSYNRNRMEHYGDTDQQSTKPEIYWDCTTRVYYEYDRYGNATTYERLSPKNYATYADYLSAFEYYHNPQSTNNRPNTVMPIYDIDRPRRGLDGPVPRGQHIDRNLVDTAVIGDSIIRKVSKIGHCHIICYPGLKVVELTELIRGNKCPELAGKRQIVVHVGTNSLDTPFQTLMIDFQNLFMMIRHTYPRANILWNSILPRGDVSEARAYKIIMVNNEQSSNMRSISVISSVRKFHRNRETRLELYKQDKLHLNDYGVLILRNTLRHNLLRWRYRRNIPTLSAQEAPYETTSIMRNWRELL